VRIVTPSSAQKRRADPAIRIGPVQPVAKTIGIPFKSTDLSHNSKENSRSYFFSIVPVEQPSAAIAKHFLIVDPVQPRERCTVTARLFYQDILACFAVCQINASH